MSSVNSRMISRPGVVVSRVQAIKRFDKRRLQKQGAFIPSDCGVPTPLEQVLHEAGALQVLQRSSSADGERVVQLRQVWTSSESRDLYFLMEYADAGPVMKLDVEAGRYRAPEGDGAAPQAIETDRSVFREESARLIFRDLLRAVRHCHQNHVAHRDIKPDNLLATSQGMVKLADFDVCRCFVLPLTSGGDGEEPRVPSPPAEEGRPMQGQLLRTRSFRERQMELLARAERIPPPPKPQTKPPPPQPRRESDATQTSGTSRSRPRRVFASFTATTLPMEMRQSMRDLQREENDALSEEAEEDGTDEDGRSSEDSEDGNEAENKGNLQEANGGNDAPHRSAELGPDGANLPEPLVDDTQGTFAFLPPEAVHSDPKPYDAYKADIWACGCTLFALLFGRPPIRRGLNSAAELTEAIQEFSSLGELPRQLSKEATRFLHRLLARDPAERPTAEEALRDPWVQAASADAKPAFSPLAVGRLPSYASIVLELMRQERDHHSGGAAASPPATEGAGRSAQASTAAASTGSGAEDDAGAKTGEEGGSAAESSMVADDLPASAAGAGGGEKGEGDGTLQGWLVKRGRMFKTWRRRFFYARDGMLFYFKGGKIPSDGNLASWTATQLQQQAAGEALWISDILEIARTREVKFDHAFFVRTPARTLYLRAESDDEAGQWIDALRQERDRCRANLQ